MADTFWGETPEELTVSASPTPTTTVFTVSDGTNLVEKQYILVKVSGVYLRAKIATGGVSGNVVTLAAALSGAPDTPGSVLNSRELIKRDDLVKAGMFRADDPGDLGSVDVTRALDGMKYFVSQKGAYRRDASSARPADGELVKDPNSGSGQWLWETDNGNLAGAHLAPLIFDSLPCVTSTVDFASMNTLTGASSSAITVSGARSGDLVQVQPVSAMTNGVQVSGYVNAKNQVTLRAFNGTGSTQDPASNDFKIWVTTPYRIPPLTATALQQFEALLNGDYNSTTLQTLLGDGLQLAHFSILLACRQYMQQLQDDSTARSAISGSALANAVMESYDGAGW